MAAPSTRTILLQTARSPLAVQRRKYFGRGTAIHDLATFAASARLLVSSRVLYRVRHAVLGAYNVRLRNDGEGGRNNWKPRGLQVNSVWLSK